MVRKTVSVLSLKPEIYDSVLEFVKKAVGKRPIEALYKSGKLYLVSNGETLAVIPSKSPMARHMDGEQFAFITWFYWKPEAKGVSIWRGITSNEDPMISVEPEFWPFEAVKTHGFTFIPKNVDELTKRLIRRNTLALLKLAIFDERISEYVKARAMEVREASGFFFKNNREASFKNFDVDVNIIGLPIPSWVGYALKHKKAVRNVDVAILVVYDVLSNHKIFNELKDLIEGRKSWRN